MEAVVIVLALTLLALAADRWGVDSVDRLDSPEWERRRHWPGLSASRSRPDRSNR